MPKGTKSPPQVALIQLGPEAHSALNELAKRSGETKSEIVRRALRGLAAGQEGFWEEVFIELNILLAEMTEEAVTSGLIDPKEGKGLADQLDRVRQSLYGRLDEIDGLPSIHWAPKQGNQVRPYAEVQKLRAQRGALIEPELEGLRSLHARFHNESQTVRRYAKSVKKTALEVAAIDAKNEPSRR